MTHVLDAPISLSVLIAAVQTLTDSGAEGRRVIVATCGQLLRRPTLRRMDSVLNILDVLCARSTDGSSGVRSPGRITLSMAILGAVLKGARP